MPYISKLDPSKIEEDESDDSNFFNQELRKIDISNYDLKLLGLTAKLFKNHQEEIMNNWYKLETDNFRKFPVLKEGIGMLLDGFIESLSIGDLDRYFESNALIGKKIAVENIPYCVFMKSFHHFEDSYSIFLIKNYGHKILKFTSLLDNVHHVTISIAAQEYFKQKDGIIFSMAKLAEKRNSETGNHLYRTRAYAGILAQRLECRQNFVENIYLTSPLHDIGKVSIRDNILLKPGVLSNEEFEIMKTHAKEGSNTIKEVRNKYRIRGYL